ncbi:MAG: hypothetical protein ABI217_11650 [Chthoniobacterales bacterium]
MLFLEQDPETRAILLVGFLAQKDGAVLRRFDRAGTLIEKRHYATVIMPGAVGGLDGSA